MATVFPVFEAPENDAMVTTKKVQNKKVNKWINIKMVGGHRLKIKELKKKKKTTTTKINKKIKKKKKKHTQKK